MSYRPTYRPRPKRKLQELSKEWEETWNSMFADLAEYRASFGDCNVSKGHGKLGRWVDKQRTLFSRNTLPPDRYATLDLIDFRWPRLRQDAWDDMFIQLVQYKEEFGDCEVPLHNKRLENWLYYQRFNKDLEPECKKKLQTVIPGFDNDSSHPAPTRPVKIPEKARNLPRAAKSQFARKPTRKPAKPKTVTKKQKPAPPKPAPPRPVPRPRKAPPPDESSSSSEYDSDMEDEEVTPKATTAEAFSALVWQYQSELQAFY